MGEGAPRAFAARLFKDDAAVRRVGEGLIHCTLPKTEWTHEAHLAACVFLILETPDLVPERDMPGLIRRYNESVGGVNDETQGYHETITQLYIRAIRAFLAGRADAAPVDAVNAVLASPIAPRDWPLHHYSRERLFSSEARKRWMEPDVLPLAQGSF